MTLTEKQITKAVIDHWRACHAPNTLVATIPNQFAHGQYGLTPGLPDLLCIGPSMGVSFIELKTERGKLSEAQQAFADLCFMRDVDWHVCRGRDEPITMLRALGLVRGRA